MNILIRLKFLLVFPVLVTILGLLLLIFMITAEDEASPVPPLMIVIGLFWSFRIKSRITSITNT
ncbi:MAG: hypothetical protein JJ971_04355 [Balneolaceae bacterium]|nr:hypothetical protein [Balneolaceae bacterium]MBO6545606.1 hypothetical protein [Balneolaceae bacterium]MBO6647002.1 hypothetical protein [Balneolaceae bacterium]